MLNETGKLIIREPDISRPASELFPFSHLRMSTEDLFYSGWMSDRTRAIIHDFALYSAQKDAYVSVRLVLEYGPEHGGFICSKHVRAISAIHLKRIAQNRAVVGRFLTEELDFDWHTHCTTVGADPVPEQVARSDCDL